MGSTRKGPDGVETYPASARDIETYLSTERNIPLMRIPRFLREEDPNDRLFIAGLDGTGNSMYKDEANRHSVIAQFYHQIDQRHRSGETSVAGGYVQGTYTQDNWLVRTTDGMLGHSFDERVETAYWQLCKQAKQWLDENPDAAIHVIVTGFSRGAEQAAALTRLIHERGIMDPDKAKVSWNDRERIVAHAAYNGESLVPPGRTLQAVLLYDPVSTGVREHDRRLAPSVATALQITARDEPRDPFDSNLLVQPGMSRDGRFNNAIVAGVHSSPADTYPEKGLGTLGYNLGVAYLNRFSDQPLLEKRPLPDDRSLYVLHRSDQHSILWTTRGFRDGQRDLRDDLAPVSACRPQTAPVCRQAEPTDPAVLQRIEGLLPDVASIPATADTRDDIDAIFERLTQAAMHGDRAGMHAALDQWRSSPDGLAAQRAGREHLERLQALSPQGEQSRAPPAAPAPEPIAPVH